MTEQEQLIKTINDEVAKQLESFKETHVALIKGLMPVEQAQAKFDEISEQISKLPKDNQAEMKTQLETIIKEHEELSLKVGKLGDNSGSKKQVTEVKGLGTMFKEALVEAKMTSPVEQDGRTSLSAKDYFKRNTEAVSLEAKAAIDMTMALSSLPGSTPGTSIGYLSSYSPKKVLLDASKDDHLMDIVSVVPTTRAYFGVVIYYDEFDGVATTAQNTSLSQSSFKIKTTEFKVHDIGAKARVSESQLEDIDGVEAEFNRIMPDRIKSVIDTKALATNTVNDTDLIGLRGTGYNTAFVASTYSASVVGASKIDVIAKMKLQARNADQMVDTVILTANEVDEIASIKDLNNNNIADRRLTFDNTGRLVKVCGLVIIENNKFSDNEAIVMSSEAAEFGLRQDVSIIVGHENDDLSKRMRTIIFYVRVALAHRKPAAVIYCDDLDTAEAEIDQV